jgi:hypothetical protein
MKVRKDKIKEGLVKASLDNFKERIASGDTSYNDEKPRSKSKTTQKVIPNAKEILEKMGAVNTAIAGKAQAVSSYTNEKIDNAVNKPAHKSSEYSKSTSIKIVGLDSDKDDLNLALKYIIQLNPCAPLKNITVMCDRYSSFTASLVAKTVGKIYNTSDYQKMLMDHGSVKIDEIFVDKKGNNMLVFLNSAKKYSDIKDWYFNEAVYNLTSLMVMRQLRNNSSFNMKVRDCLKSIYDTKEISGIDNKIIDIIGKDALFEILDATHENGMLDAIDTDEYFCNAIQSSFIEYDAYSIISEIRPKAIDNVMYKCTDVEIGAIKDFVTRGVRADVIIDHLLKTEDTYPIDSESVIILGLQWAALGKNVDDIGFPDDITELIKILVSKIQVLNTTGYFNAVDYAVILRYITYKVLKITIVGGEKNNA